MPTPRYRLVCFDLDGTLVDGTIFVWRTLHEAFGSDVEQLRAAREAFHAGRISYADWFEADLRLLRDAGATRAHIGAVLRGLVPMRGAHALLRELRSRGHRLAVISGSLDIVLEGVVGAEHFDHVLLNRIRFDEQGVIAGGEATDYDLERKADGLRELCRREGIDPSAAAFIGDNSNDVHVARAAGLSIAFDCKSAELRAACDHEVVEKDLLAVLPYLGNC